MEVKQVYSLVNDVTSEVLGKQGILQEDLSNVVDLGSELFNSNAYDNYVKKLVNRIGRVIFVDRPYRGGVPSVLMDGWEYGSVLEKIRSEMPEAQENQSWQLEDGASYDENIFHAPKVSVKFFNEKSAFEIPLSITEKQLRESFTGADQLRRFVSLLYTQVDNSMTVKTEGLVMRTIDNMIAETLYADFPTAQYAEGSGIKAINLLKLYTEATGNATTVATCLHDMNFLKFASYVISVYTTRIGRISTLFNIGGTERFTPRDSLHIVLLSDFAEASKVYLQSPTYHDDLVRLPNYESVPYWQGSGTNYALSDISKIHLKTSGGHEVEASGILGVMFDRDALGVCNEDRRTTTKYVASAEFYNNWFKWDAQHFNDLNENMIVFFVA